jgi:hypothetical protein
MRRLSLGDIQTVGRTRVLTFSAHSHYSIFETIIGKKDCQLAFSRPVTKNVRVRLAIENQFAVADRKFIR